MNKSSIKIALFVCIACSIVIGASLFLSIKISQEHSPDLKVFKSSGDKINEFTDSYEYIKNQSLESTVPQNGISDSFAEFEYENINFVSYSQQWGAQKLEKLANEFFQNVHGEEMAYVARVELHDDNDDEYLGLHRNSYEKHSVPIAINHLLPNNMTLDLSALSSVIVLTGANENTTVASMARTLSHEYGHHFAQYYFGFRGTIADMTSKYATLRKESGAPIYSVVTNWDDYLDNHMWDLQEIAAEDYVFLMGSPLARQQVDYLDNSELADLFSRNEEKYNETTSMSVISLNSFPHENPVLASPSQTKGLADYYYSFVDEDAPQYTKVSSYGDLDMNITTTSPGSYTMNWNLPWTYSNITYTLVAYDSTDYMIRPIRTITGDQEGIAYFGAQKILRNQNEYTIDDGLDDIGFVRFRVIVVFSDGSVIFSDPYDVRF